MLVFSVEGFQARLWGYKLSARISVLLPFQAMILFGLAGLPSLPLPLFSYAFSRPDQILSRLRSTIMVVEWDINDLW